MPSKARKDTGARRRRRAAWPLRGERYLSTPSISRNAVSTGESVRTLRGALGLDPGGYDEALRNAVMDAQAKAGLEVTGVVTEKDWHAIVNPERRSRARGRSATRPRRVDAAQETDEPAGELDAPEGTE